MNVVTIPTGLHPSAQGCEARATLGPHPKNIRNPEGVASLRVGIPGSARASRAVFRAPAEHTNALVIFTFQIVPTRSFRLARAPIGTRGARVLPMHMAVRQQIRSRFSCMGSEGSAIMKTAWLCALVIGWAGCTTRGEKQQITVERRNGGVERVEVQKKQFVWPWWAPTIEHWSE